MRSLSMSRTLSIATSPARNPAPQAMRPTGVWGAFLSICANAGHSAFTSPAKAFASHGRRCIDQAAGVGRFGRSNLLCRYPVALLNRIATSDDIIFMPLTYGYATYGIQGYGAHRLTYAARRQEGRRHHGWVGMGILKNCRAPEFVAHHISWLSSPEVQRGLYTFAGG